MAYEGGPFTVIPDGSMLPGARINVIAKQRVNGLLSPRGRLAVPLIMNWGADEKVIEFTQKDFTRDSLYVFGYENDSEELANIGEMFKGATELVVVRLNGDGEKAKCDFGEAKWPGIRGNDLEISIDVDPDAGYTANPLSNTTVTFSAEENKLIATYKNLPEGYKPDSSLYINGVKVEPAKGVISRDITADTVTYSLTTLATEGEYSVRAKAVKDLDTTLISTGSYTVEFHPKTQRKSVLVKGNEEKGQEIPEDLNSVTVEFDIKNNKITAKYDNLPEGYEIKDRIFLNTAITAVIPGRLEQSKGTKSVTYTLYPDAASKGTYKLEIRAYKTADRTYTTLATQEFTMTVEGEDKDAYTGGTYTDAQPEDNSGLIPKKFIVKTFLDGEEVDKQKVASMGRLKDRDFIVWDREKKLEQTAGVILTGGTNGTVTGESWNNALNRLENEYFHILACPTSDETIKSMFIEYTKEMRSRGIYFQTVMPVTADEANYTGVIQVYNTVTDDVEDPDAALVYWVAGKEAGCKVQDTIGNIDYDGIYTIDVDFTQRDLERAVTSGYLVFHLARGNDRKQHIRVNLDINTLTSPSKVENETFKRNQTIRVIDQSCNDIATIFNNDFVEIVPSDQAGREALQMKIAQYFIELETIRAITEFDSATVIVEETRDKPIIRAEVVIKPVNAMEQLYLTIYVD